MFELLTESIFKALRIISMSSVFTELLNIVRHLCIHKIYVDELYLDDLGFYNPIKINRTKARNPERDCHQRWRREATQQSCSACHQRWRRKATQRSCSN